MKKLIYMIGLKGQYRRKYKLRLNRKILDIILKNII